MNIDELLKLWSEKAEPADMSSIRNDIRAVAEYSAVMVEEFVNAGFSRGEALLLMSEIIKANMK